MHICIYVYFQGFTPLFYVCPLHCMNVQERLLTCRNAVCRDGIATHKICDVMFLVSNISPYVQCAGMHAFCIKIVCLRCFADAHTCGCDVKKDVLLAVARVSLQTFNRYLAKICTSMYKYLYIIYL